MLLCISQRCRLCWSSFEPQLQNMNMLVLQFREVFLYKDISEYNKYALLRGTQTTQGRGNEQDSKLKGNRKLKLAMLSECQFEFHMHS